MSYSGGIINAPVSIYDIQQAIGVSGNGDLGTLCAHENVNMWAKYKPVRYPAIDTTKNPSNPSQAWLNSDKTWKTDSYVIWWRNPKDIYTETINTCGFSIPASQAVNENIASTLGAWDVERPRGGANEPFREIDFNQYYHNAVCPFSIVELPARAVLLPNDKLFAKVRFMTPSVNALNLTLNDIFGQAGGTVYFGVAVVIGNAAYAITNDDGTLLISLEDLKTVYRGLSVGDELTLVTFITRNKHATWSTGNYQVYSLEAPGITFPTQGICKVITTLQTQYAIVVNGFEPVDKTVLMPNVASLTDGNVIADNRSYNEHTGVSPNPQFNYAIDSVKCVCELVDIDLGTTTQVYEGYYQPSGPSADITVEPATIEHNGGPYRQMKCTSVYSPGEPQDPTKQYYQITYTLIYQR